MKKTLRFTCLFIVGLVVSFSSQAQRQIPLTLSFISPTAGQQVEYGENYYCIFSIHNGSSTESLSATDTLIIAFRGEPDFQYSDQIMLVLSPAIAPGGTANLPIFVNPNHNTTGAAINKEYCVAVFGQGNFFETGAWMNSSADPFGEACVEFSLLSGPEVVSVNEVDGLSNFNVYPNPANGQINISLDGISADAVIMIHNAFGQRLYESNVSTFRGVGSINSAEWNSGIYLVTITQNGTSKTQRINVQH